MVTTILDVLKVELVLDGVMLLLNPEEIEAFRSVVDADVVVTDKGAFNLGKRFTFGRERIVLDTDMSSSVQTTLSREYPVETDLGRLTEVAGHAITQSNLLDQQPQGSVYRIDLIYDQDSGLPAAKYLANKLFTAEVHSHAGWELQGGFSRIVFADGDRQWGVSVEPRFGSDVTNTVYLSLARFSKELRLPNEGEIGVVLEEVWCRAHDFPNQLDERMT